MRRHGRSVHRKRIEAAAGEPDALGLALAGLACGLLAVLIVFYAATLERVPVKMPLIPIAAPSSASPVAPVTTGGSLSAPDSSSFAALTSGRGSDRP